MTDVFVPCVRRALRLGFHKKCRCTTGSSLEAALFTGLSLAVFNPNQVTGDCAPAFSSRSRLHVDKCYCRENSVCWGRESRASLHAVGLGPKSSQVHQRQGTKSERRIGVWPWLGCGSCSGPKDRSLSLKLWRPHKAPHCPNPTFGIYTPTPELPLDPGR